MWRRWTLATAVLGTICPWTAGAQDMVYAPVNPSFGGNPFNSSHLLGVAGAVNEYKDPNAPVPGATSQAQLFAQQLQSRLLSALAAQVTEAIFGDNPQERGTIRFGGQTITFTRTLDQVTLTIANETTGENTVVEIPTFVSVR